MIFFNHYKCFDRTLFGISVWDVLGLVNLEVVHLSLVSDLLKRRYLRNIVWKNVVAAKEKGTFATNLKLGRFKPGLNYLSLINFLLIVSR